MLSDLFFRYGFNEEFNFDTLRGKRLNIILQMGPSVESSFTLCSKKLMSVMVLFNKEVFNPSAITHGIMH